MFVSIYCVILVSIVVWQLMHDSIDADDLIHTELMQRTPRQMIQLTMDEPDWNSCTVICRIDVIIIADAGQPGHYQVRMSPNGVLKS